MESEERAKIRKMMIKEVIELIDNNIINTRNIYNKEAIDILKKYAPSLFIKDISFMFDMNPTITVFYHQKSNVLCVVILTGKYATILSQLDLIEILLLYLKDNGLDKKCKHLFDASKLSSGYVELCEISMLTGLPFGYSNYIVRGKRAIFLAKKFKGFNYASFGNTNTTTKTYILYDKKLDLYKIGFSYNIENRVKDINKETKRNFKPIYYNLFNIENEIHIRYKEYCVNGEYFDLPKPILDEIIRKFHMRPFEE